MKYLKMKNYVALIISILTLTSCFKRNYESELIKSPTGNFEIKTTVNRTDKNADNYADVIIHIFDIKSNMVTLLNTGVGDFSKWSVGWTKIGDTIVLQSSDIGNKAWIISNNKPIEIKMTDNLNNRAEFLKSQKYD
ncbi:conserved hypothetical protein [Tenacibaculum sp. 190524A05c]